MTIFFRENNNNIHRTYLLNSTISFFFVTISHVCMTPLHFRFFASQFWSSEKLLIESFKACSSCIFLKMNMYAKYIYVYICLIYIIIEKKTSYEIGASRIYTQPAPNAENCYSGWTHS